MKKASIDNFPSCILHFLLFFFFFSSCILQAQHYSRNDTIPVRINGNWLKNPWVGGHNYVQMSTIDMNFDGIKDLFVFDRSGNKITAYINKGIADSVNYVDSTFKYASKFPHMEDWVLLRDYNCDGKEDIFTWGIIPGGIKVYRNISTASNLQFILQTKPVIQSNYPPLLDMNVTWLDIPTIADIDVDGDLDILSFGFGEPYKLDYHINKSMEMGYSCDSLIFQLDPNGCWGNFDKNSGSCIINIKSCRIGNPDSSQGSADNHEWFKKSPASTDNNHRASTRNGGDCSLCLDLDADGDMDLLTGELSCCNIFALTNTGTQQSANITSVDMNFPSDNIPVNINAFPCGYYIDLNNDNKRDLVVCPNASSISLDIESIWYYKNIGADNSPVFSRQTRSFLQEDMIDVGTGSDPVFFDFDNDGLSDLLISNYTMISDSCPTSNSFNVYAFKNIGSATNPMFDLIDNDYANLSSQLPNYSSKHLTFGDLDGDGDQDMIIGDYNGFLHYFENTGGMGPANFSSAPPILNYPDNTSAPIDVGGYATPQLIDADRDGDLDLIIGERAGNLNYYQNIGTTTTPSFAFITNSFGGVDVLIPCCTGYSVPFMYDSAGSYKLLVASEANINIQNSMGHIWLYKNIDGNLSGNFTLADSLYQNIWEGTHMTVNGKDINNDGYMDLIFGNDCGGVALFTGDTLTTGIAETNNQSFDFTIYPNPFYETATLNITNSSFNDYRLSIYNIFGQEIYSETFHNSSFVINKEGLTSGIYSCEIKSENINKIKKLILIK